MIKLLRQYGWAGLAVAVVIVVAIHAGRVRLVAHLERKPADKPEQH